MPGGLWSIGSHNSIPTSGSQRALGMQHSGDSRPRQPVKICPGLSEGQEPGRTPRGVTLDTTDPKNLSQLALPPNSVPAWERAGRWQSSYALLPPSEAENIGKSGLEGGKSRTLPFLIWHWHSPLVLGPLTLHFPDETCVAPTRLKGHD